MTITKTAELRLLDGAIANYMGEGIWAVLQDSDEGPQSVVITEENMRDMLGLSEG